MTRWLLAAGLIAAGAASPALAADIDGIPPPPHSSPYGTPYGAPYGGGPYTDQRYAPRPPAYDDGERYGGRPPARRYSNTPPKYAAPPPGRACARSEQVRDRLSAEGWRDFHDGKPMDERLVTLRARRPNGRLFELMLHRCTGEVVEARPLQLRPFGPYAYRHQPYGPDGSGRWGPGSGQETAPYADEDDDGWEERSYAHRGPWRRWYRD